MAMFLAGMPGNSAGQTRSVAGQTRPGEGVQALPGPAIGSS